MRLALIAHGLMPIPPRSWGAVEGTLWLRKRYLERLGHTVDIYNTPMIHDVVHRLNQQRYDFVHCHNELFAWACTRYLEGPYAFTSHHGGWHAFAADQSRRPELRYLLAETLEAPVNFVLSERIADVYRGHGYQGLLRVLPNAVETEAFRVAPRGEDRAVCVGVVSPRKRQAWLAETLRGRVPIDFVGPWDRAQEPSFRPCESSRYLGTWDRSTLHQRLTGYGCLVLLSESEAAPKVVLEALAAGLNVVTNTAGTANLTPQPFITVLPDDERRPEVIADAVRAALAANPALRPLIRAYAEEHLGYSVAVSRYLRFIEEARATWYDRPQNETPANDQLARSRVFDGPNRD